MCEICFTFCFTLPTLTTWLLCSRLFPGKYYSLHNATETCSESVKKRQPAGPPSLKEKFVYALNFGYTKNTYDEKYLFFQLMRKIGQDKNSIFRRVKMCFYGCNRSHHIFRLNWWSQSAQRLCPNFVSFEKLNLGKGIQGKTKTCQLMLSKDFRDLKRAGTMAAAISTTSQRFMKEKPRKRPRVPPNSATKDKKGYDWGW